MAPTAVHRMYVRSAGAAGVAAKRWDSAVVYSSASISSGTAGLAMSLCGIGMGRVVWVNQILKYLQEDI